MPTKTANSPTQFLSTLWRGGQYSYYWTAPNRQSYWFPTDKIESQICPNGGQNVYFGVNPVLQIPDKNARGEPKPPQAVRSQNNYIGAVNTLFCEFDFKDFGDAATIRDHLKAFPFPSIAIFSGGGYHFYWLLDETFTINTDSDRERIRSIQANWVEFTGSDKQSKDIARVLRVPGTVNYKPQYGPDFPTVKIVKEDYSLTYNINYLDDLSRPAPQPEPERLPAPTRDATEDDAAFFSRQALTVAANMVKDAPDGEKHGTLLRAARLLGGYIGGGIVAEQEAINTLELEIANRGNVDSLDLAYRTISNGIAYGKAQPITLEQKIAEREEWQRQNYREDQAHAPEPAQVQAIELPPVEVELLPPDIYNAEKLANPDWMVIFTEGQPVTDMLTAKGFDAVGTPDVTSFDFEQIKHFSNCHKVYLAFNPQHKEQTELIKQEFRAHRITAYQVYLPCCVDEFFLLYGGNDSDFFQFLMMGKA